MKIIYTIVLVGLFISCQQRKIDKSSIYVEYLESYNQQGFEKASSYLHDTIIITDGDYSKQYLKHEYADYFQWDSVFKPQFNLKILNEQQDYLEIIEKISSKRFEFLDNNPLIMRKKIYFESGKITEIENVEYQNVNWSTWTENRDSLVNWIDKQHPELSGFINDMTKTGGMNYLKAIELYKKRPIIE